HPTLRRQLLKTLQLYGEQQTARRDRERSSRLHEEPAQTESQPEERRERDVSIPIAHLITGHWGPTEGNQEKRCGCERRHSEPESWHAALAEGFSRQKSDTGHQSDGTHEHGRSKVGNYQRSDQEGEQRQ